MSNCNIHQKVLEWNDNHCNIDVFIEETIAKFDIDDRQIFEDLYDSIEYMNNLPVLKEKYFDSYLDAKYHLMIIVLNSIKNDTIHEDDISNALYDWLKVCINSKHGSKIDFYFKMHNPPLFKENEIKTILFENGELREMFKDDDWQIRLKKIKLWFLKRYDFKTSLKIYINLTNRRKSELIDFLNLRLISAILVGFLPLVFKPDIWEMKIDWYDYALAIILIPLIIGYFMYDCSKVIDSGKNNILERVLPIFFYGLFISIISSVFIYFVFFSGDPALSIEMDKRLAFLAIIAYFIGIIVQIIWQESTVVEPL